MSGKPRGFIARGCVADPIGWPRVIAAEIQKLDTHENRMIVLTKEVNPRGFGSCLGMAKSIEVGSRHKTR